MLARSFTWAGGEHDFLLKIDHLRALQDICNAGPEEVVLRLAQKRWRVDDVMSTIRLSLEGGGLDKDEAKRLVALHVEDNLATCVLLALLVLQRAIYGDPAEADDLPGEDRAEAVKNTPDLREKTENGISATSTSGAES